MRSVHRKKVNDEAKKKTCLGLVQKPPNRGNKTSTNQSARKCAHRKNKNRD